MPPALPAVAGAVVFQQPDPLETERCFRLEAEADPGLLLRALGLFAKLNLIPTRVVADYRSDQLNAEIRIAGLGDQQAEHIAQVMAGLFGVEQIKLT